MSGVGEFLTGLPSRCWPGLLSSEGLAGAGGSASKTAPSHDCGRLTPTYLIQGRRSIHKNGNARKQGLLGAIMEMGWVSQK